MKNERVRWLGLWAVTVVVAGWLGLQLGGGGAPEGGEEVTGHAPALAQGSRDEGARGLSAGELRVMMREELREEMRRAAEERRAGDQRRLAAPSADAAAAPDAHDSPDELAAAAGPPPPSPAELETRTTQALAVVERAIAVGQWRAEERQRFAAAIDRLPAASLFEVTRQLNVAINRGQITIPDGLPAYGPGALPR